jgi:predicted MFS family arabinose efflux permease
VRHPPAAARVATRLAFLVAGFGTACWGPLVPFAKQRLLIDERVLGVLLLCLGIGSMFAMFFTGALSTRYGSRRVIVVSAIGFAALLPSLAIASTPLALGACLLSFGGLLGALEVAMNVHAVEVEKSANVPLMSGFHALYSVGGFLGSAFVTSLLSFGMGPLRAVLIASGLMVLTTLVTWPLLLRTKAPPGGPSFALPHGLVLVIALLAAISFLAEGAILDWGALLITEKRMLDVNQAGVGYMLFAVAMTAGRFTGDAVVARIGDRRTLVWGGVVAIAGFVSLLATPVAAVALCGFALIGLGAANIVPVLFRRGGSQTIMPHGLAIAAISATGYAGLLAGPAAIGFVAERIGLANSLWMLPAILVLVPACAAMVAPVPMPAAGADGGTRTGDLQG